MTNPIVAFLEQRKQKPLKEGKKSQIEIEEEFRIVNWVANAASRVTQLSLVSHPGKFSHPDARISSVLFSGAWGTDGYLRSGNARAASDVVGNAAALDVYAFLSLPLSDGRSVLTHFEAHSEALRELLGVDAATFSQWCSAFLQIKSVEAQVKTHSYVKQVYFPLQEGGYHLLSVLYPSGLMTEHRERLRQMKFSEAAKAAREAKKKGQHYEQGFADIPGLLTVKFGGTKPQNISKLNSNNGGEAWLLPSLPPLLQQGYVRLPKTDFFRWLRSDAELQQLFEALHALLQTQHNVLEIRENRQRRIAQCFDWVMQRAMYLQQQPAGWSDAESFHLPLIQQLWLDAAYQEQRAQHTNWQAEIALRISEWIVERYQRYKQNDAVILGKTEVKAFQQELLAYARQHEEYML